MNRIFTDIARDEAFRKLGYVVIPGFLDAGSVRQALAFYESVAPEAGVNEPFFTSHWSKDYNFRKKTSEYLQRLLYPSAATLITGYKSVYGHYLIKQPCRGSAFKIHQDWTLIDEDRFVGITIWCALCDVSQHNGCMSVVAGSHRVSGNIRGSNIGTGVGEIPNAYLTPLEMKAGDAVAFDHRLFHASGDNLSAQVRVAAGIVLIPEEARMIHYFRDEQTGIISRYEADDHFLEEFAFGDSIEKYRKVGEIPPAATQITGQELIARLNDYKKQYEQTHF
ncbi:MAG: hypothetical protein KatS3mg031_2000 [Chitinophagales bacterium]|nr:MAG: hypothetical protein KatS3mg031_2000 [Chitinophagales bacterium]